MFSCFWHIPDWTFVDILGFVWDAAKAAVPAGVAWVAYKVSIEAKEATQAQRDIAANQYKISLYDVRKELVHRLDKWILENPRVTREMVIQLSEVINLSQDIKNLFTVPVDINYISENVEEIKSLELEISLDIADLERTDEKNIDSVGIYRKKITNNTLIRNHKSRDLYLYLKELSSNCRRQLVVPSAPY